MSSLLDYAADRFAMPTITLRDYQQQVLSALESASTRRNLAVMATGSGKTVVFAEYLRRTLAGGGRGLVLAHRDELISQAAQKISAVVPGLHVEVEKAQAFATRSTSEPGVVVASVQTLRGKRLDAWPKDAFRCIVVDEAHHAVAESYRAIFEHFGADPDGTIPLLGVTATAGRTDKIGLGAVFEAIVADMQIAVLVEAGWLCPVRAFLVKTDTTLDDVSTRAGDFAQGELEAAVDDEYRNGRIVAAYEEHAAGRQAIAYCAGVDHAHHLAGTFRARGISAESVWGAMEQTDRRRVLSQYTSGEVQVLTNFGVLTEGFDAPNTSAIIQARPTKSQLMLTQMIGRGTRPDADLAHVLNAESPKARRLQIADSRKPDVLVLDVVDKLTRGICQRAASLVGLPLTIDPQGADIHKMVKAFESLDPRLAARALCADDVRKFIEQQRKGLSLVEIDVMAATEPDPAIAPHSSLMWTRLSEDTFRIELCARPVDGEKPRRYPYRLSPNTLGTWELVDVSTGTRHTMAGLTDKRDAFRQADAHLQATHPDKLALVDRSARWRSVPPSPKQVEWLLKKGVFASASDVPASLTKGQATQLLDAAFAKRGRGNR